MTNLITQVEIMKYKGAANAVFPEGTIVTPSARDWAKEQKINIVIGRENVCFLTDSEISREELLAKAIRSVFIEYRKMGLPMVKEDIANIVIKCLKRLDCRIEG